MGLNDSSSRTAWLTQRRISKALVGHRERTHGEPDYSRIGAMTGLRMRVTGHSAVQIYGAIKANAPLMRKEVMNEREYDEKYSLSLKPRKISIC